MSIIAIMLVIALIGLIAWAIVTFIPMPPKFATAIYVLAGIFVLLYILQVFGLISGFHVPAVR